VPRLQGRNDKAPADLVAPTYHGERFNSFDEFIDGCNLANKGALRLHSFELLLRPGVIEPQVYALFVKE
jgi:hypothetical protein